MTPKVVPICLYIFVSNPPNVLVIHFIYLLSTIIFVYRSSASKKKTVKLLITHEWKCSRGAFVQMIEKKIIEQIPYPKNLTRIILNRHDNNDLITSAEQKCRITI